MSILATIGRLKPHRIADLLQSLLQQSQKALVTPPQELVHHLVHSLCCLVAAPGGYTFIRPALAALAGGGKTCLLASGKYERSNVQFVLEELIALANAYLAQHGPRTAAHGTAHVYAELPTETMSSQTCGIVGLPL